jgi:hypothetical protein
LSTYSKVNSYVCLIENSWIHCWISASIVSLESGSVVGWILSSVGTNDT